MASLVKHAVVWIYLSNFVLYCVDFALWHGRDLCSAVFFSFFSKLCRHDTALTICSCCSLVHETVDVCLLAMLWIYAGNNYILNVLVRV